MDILFLGGIYTKDIEQFAHNYTKGPLQIAADTLQKGFLEGLDKNMDVKSITVINLPFIGSYPQYFKKPKFKPKSAKDTLFNKISIINQKFNNLIGIKNISRAFQAFFALKKTEARNKVIICYSMHLPFLISIFMYKKLLSKKQKFYVVIPDLPEYMSERKGMKRVFFKIINHMSYFIVNRSNGISVITKKMATRFNTSLPSVVIEGISITSATKNIHNDIFALPFNALDSRYCLYTGTLDARYGIKDLISAYNEAHIHNMLLIICGEGNEKKSVINACKKNKHILYLGQIPRDKVLFLQKNASLLINPRSDEELYTAYSFPSKIIEYMASGSPVLMYKLKGIPESYEGKYYKITSSNDLALKLKWLSGMEDSELRNMGAKAKEFISSSVNPSVQVNKLITLIKQ